LTEALVTKANNHLRLAEGAGARSSAADLCRTAAMPATPALVIALPDLAVPGRISTRRVLEVTAEHFRTTPDDLVSHCRKRPLVRHRQIAMYVARKVTGRGLPFIARVMGNRDHTTILHGVRAVQARIDAGDAETAAAVDRIVERLQVAVQIPPDAGDGETIAVVNQIVAQLQVAGRRA
jgi:chromosomal replication initiation ATPase DnaA